MLWLTSSTRQGKALVTSQRHKCSTLHEARPHLIKAYKCASKAPVQYAHQYQGRSAFFTERSGKAEHLTAWPKRRLTLSSVWYSEGEKGMCLMGGDKALHNEKPCRCIVKRDGEAWSQATRCHLFTLQSSLQSAPMSLYRSMEIEP